MAKVGRNEPCLCGSGHKAKRCCGVQRGPSEESLARAFIAREARRAAREVRDVSREEHLRLLDELPELPALDLSLQAELPQLLSPTHDRLIQAVAADDPDAGMEWLVELLETYDSWRERARLARAAIALRDSGRLDAKLAAVALIELDIDEDRPSELVVASLFQAAAVKAGVTRTPAGILLAT